MFKRSDLQFTYAWIATPPNEADGEIEPDHSLFNRREGYEVLYLINQISDAYNLDRKGGLKIERMIHDHLPGDIRSRKNVRHWIELNWARFE